LRRIRVGKNEALYSYLAENYPELLEDDFFKPTIQAIITVPQKAPEGAITRKAENALDLLERNKQFNKEWIRPGHRKGVNKHNVSATVTIKQGEWDDVGQWLWDNKKYFTALSFLPEDLGTYTQAPFETITKEEFDKRVSSLHNIDLSQVTELSDETDLNGELACAAGNCEIQ